LGTGIISTALKQGKAKDSDVQFIMRQMAELNRIPSEIMVRNNAHAATDITGFGLAGHACEIARASNITIRLVAERLPLVPNVIGYSIAGFLPGGLHENRGNFQTSVKAIKPLPQELENLLYDPQTSGGLLISVQEADAQKVLAEIQAAGILTSAIIGEALPRGEKDLEIT
jgi:selenide,water dikinase